MAAVPTLHYSLPARKAGAFGGSQIGRVAEWLTVSWLRLEATLVWIGLVAVLLMTPRENMVEAAGYLLLSPLLALLMLFVLKGAGWLVFLTPVPIFGRTLGGMRLAFLWIFSRLVVEPAPSVEMPLWIGR